jgi:hypothetical protein
MNQNQSMYIITSTLASHRRTTLMSNQRASEKKYEEVCAAD